MKHLLLQIKPTIFNTKSIFLFLLLTSLSYSQQPTQEWVARYQSPTGISGIANKMALDKVGNCYILGEFLDINNDVIFIKYNSAGDTLWTKAYQSAGNDLPYGVIADSIGNSYITLSSGPDFGPYNIVTIKYNPQGVQQWLKIYDSGGSDEPRDIIMDKQGNLFITGFTSFESLIIKYNSNNGDTVLVRRYSETDFSFYGSHISIDNQNNIIIGGSRSHNIHPGVIVFFVIKYDVSGNFMWIAPNPLCCLPSLRKLKVDSNNNIVVTGSMYTPGDMIIKYSPSGTGLWQSTYNGPGGENFYDMGIDNQDNIIVAGSSNGDYITIKYNTSNGDSIWVRRYNGTANLGDEINSLGLDGINNIYVTGRSQNAGASYDYATIKYNSSGVQQWLTIYNGPIGTGEDIAHVIKVDRLNNVYVTGKSRRFTSGPSDYVTIKYSQPVGIINISNNSPNQFYLYQNYPNPFNPLTNIKYKISKNSFVKLAVYNVLGSEVTVLVNDFQQAGTYQADFNASNYPSGIYFYRLTASEYTESRKMLLVK